MSRFKRKDLPKFKRTDSSTQSSPDQDSSEKAMAVARSSRNNGDRNGKLTKKQMKFVDEYLVDLNATQAAIRAGYSKETAGIIGFQNLTKLKIAEGIQKRRDELKASTQMTQEWVLERYKRLADYHLADFFGDDGQLKPLSEIPESALYAVTGFKNLNSQTVREGTGGKQTTQALLQDLKLTDKKGVLDSIGKHLGMFEQDNNQRRPNVSHPIQINVSLES